MYIFGLDFSFSTKTLPSSAYSLQVFSRHPGRLFMNMMNKVGPRTDPCGAPLARRHYFSQIHAEFEKLNQNPPGISLFCP